MADILASTNSLRVPGRLVSAPTTTSGSFPYGGTDLGHTAGGEWMPNQDVQPLPMEEYGQEPGEYQITHEAPVYFTVLRGMYSAMMAKVFASSTSGSGAYGVTGDDSRLGSASEFKLMFVPRDTANHPALIMYRAIPAFGLAAKLQLMVDREIGLAVAFYGIRHATLGIYEINALGSLTVT